MHNTPNYLWEAEQKAKRNAPINPPEVMFGVGLDEILETEQTQPSRTPVNNPWVVLSSAYSLLDS